jgi:hypothetical protein
MLFDMKPRAKVGSATRFGKSLMPYERATLALQSMRYGAPRAFEP